MPTVTGFRWIQHQLVQERLVWPSGGDEDRSEVGGYGYQRFDKSKGLEDVGRISGQQE